MKTRILSLFAGILCLSVAFVSCQKENNTTTDYTTEISTHSDDQSRFSAETDASANEVNGVMEVTSSFSGRGDQLQGIICDATVVVDSVSNPRTITITYNGANCSGTRTRTGVVVISMAQGVRWKNAGAQINVSFQNLKITRIRDNKSITINGTQTFTNVSGGLLVNLVTLGTITHTITSNNMSVTFDDGSQRTWQVARQRVFTYNNGIVITTTGTHTDGAVTNIAEWGTNRFGRAFTTSTVAPLVVRQDCDFRLTSGSVKHVTPVITGTVTFGLDANGNPTSCPGTGTYYYKVVWTGANGNTHTLILPY
jgi:hypothetical protein